MRHASRIWLGVLFLTVSISATAGAEFRTWKAAVGNFSIEAEFVELKDDNAVRLRLKDGKHRDVPFDKLSTKDQDYVSNKISLPAPPTQPPVPSNTKSPAPTGTPNRERIAKLEKDVARCQTAEEALRLYRVFRDDQATTTADRQAIDSKISELRSLAEKKMVRLKGQWVTAEAFQKNRDQANVLMKQGLELLRLKQEDSFRKKFGEAAELEPDQVRAEFMIAIIYGVMAHDAVKARQYYDACLKRDPDNVAVMNNLALTLARKGDTQTSAMLWRKAAELAPDQRIVQNLGRFLDLASQKKISASKATLDVITNTYATLISSGKFERADLKQGWLYMLIDADALSLTDDSKEENKASKDNRPPPAEDGSVVVGGGTGWVVHPQYILTNNHVVDGGTSFEIQLSEGDKKTMKATLVASQKSPDLALLKCDELDAPPLTIDPTPLRRGTDIMTLGFPEMFKLGASLKATRGVISAVPAAALDEMYLYDAVVNPGNSGGPVFDNHGNVVAVTTVLYMTAGRYGGGIPSSVALDFAKKHISDFRPGVPSREVLDWPLIDQQVSPSTVLIWSRSKTPGESKSALGDGTIEDKFCMVCSGLRGTKCPIKICKEGQIILNQQKGACPACKGVGAIPCADCNATGIELALIPEKSASSNDGPSNLPEGNTTGTPSYLQSPLNPDLVNHINTMMSNGQTRDTAQAGTGDVSFRDPGPSLLIGFYLNYNGKAGEDLLISSIRTIALTGGGRSSRSLHGSRVDRQSIRVEAKPGYAVGGLKLKAGSGINGMIVVFMKINGRQLDPKDSYESEYYGGPGGAWKTLGMDGSLIIGTYGKVSSDSTSLMGLGLITTPKS
jgi:S1-C subfamily serine protease